MIRWYAQPRSWIVVALGLVLLGLGGVSFVQRIGALEADSGVDWTQSSRGAVAVAVDPGSASWSAGLREGDLLVAVEGRAVTSALEASEIGWGSGPVRVTVRRGTATRNLLFAPDMVHRSEPYAYLVIVGLAFWLSGLFLAVRLPAVRGGTVYVYFAACLFAQLTSSPTGRADALDWAFYWLDVVAEALAPALLLHVAVAMTRRAPGRRGRVLAPAYAASASLVIAALWLSPSALGGAYRFADPAAALGLRDRAAMLLLGLSVALSTQLLVQSYGRTASVMHRGQMRWLIWGLGIGMGPFVLFYAFPWSFGAPDLPPWAQFLAVVPMLVVPASFTAALARYRLHDLDVILVRGLTEVTAVVFTFAVLAASVFLLREGVSEIVPLSRSASRYAGFLIAAIAYPQLRVWIKRGMERAFYRQRYSYRATLLDWARELSAETDLPSLIGHLRRRVRQTLGVPVAEVLIRTGSWRFEAPDGTLAEGPLELDAYTLERLERDPYLATEAGALAGVPWARFLFSMRVKGRLRAVLAITERESPEEPLSSEDRALLATLAAHAGTAIEAARLVMEVRRRAEEVEQLHGRQARILDGSAVGLLLQDAEGRIQAWNRRLEEISGLPRTAAVGRKLHDVLPLQVVRRIEREVGRSEPGREARLYRVAVVNRNGRRVTVNISISPVGGDDGVADGTRVITFDDVTEQVQLEEQVLQQERLASLGLLAAGVAHEINTPLTGISSYAQMMLEENDRGDPRNDMLEKICDQTRRASSIAGSLLTLARPERTEFEALDLNATIEQVLQLFAPQVRGCRVDLVPRLDPHVPVVRGNRGKLQQVVLNLLMNARDAVGGQGEIRIATRTAGDRAVLEVSDNGSGIAEDDLPRIFDPFFTTKGRGKGTGLGLSISYGIVQEHAGEIRAVSDPAAGTCFRVELPAERPSRALA